MKIRPIHSRVLVKRDPPTEKTKGGIIVPDMAREKLTIGTVLAVGPGRITDSGRRIEPDVKKDDRIVFGKYSGSEVEHGGENDQIFMNEDEILGVIEEE